MTTTTLSIDVTTRVDELELDRLWRAYREAFEPLERRAATRMVMHSHELVSQLLDDRIVKVVARDGDGRVAGMSTTTTDLEAVDWLSPSFYAAYTSRPVHYLLWMFATAQHRSLGTARALVAPIIERARLDGGVIAYDTCLSNEERGFGRIVERLAVEHGYTTARLADVQRYYVWDHPSEED